MNKNKKLSACLPTWCYYDEEFFQLEKQYLFDANWMLVCHKNDIPKPRDYFTLDILGERILVVRNHDNTIHALHNVCRHRGSKLLSKQQGSCPHTLSCPFHGWTYQLDGKLIAVPAENTFKDLNKEDHGLVKLECEIWHGFIFIRFHNHGESLQQQMRPIEHIIEPYQLDSMLPLQGGAFCKQRPYNWKVIHDIDNEGYHVPVGHPALQQLYGRHYEDVTVDNIPVSYAPLNQQSAKLWSVKMYQKLLPTFPHLPEKNQRLWFYVGLFPNTVFAFYPDSMEFYMTIPLSTKKTIYRGASYALPDQRREVSAVRYLTHRINRVTDREDEDFVSGLQENMKSSVYPEPLLSEKEAGVSAFHHRIMEVLPIATSRTHPGKGKVIEQNQELLK